VIFDFRFWIDSTDKSRGGYHQEIRLSAYFYQIRVKNPDRTQRLQRFKSKTFVRTEGE